ncbi:uncharacterized protein CEXT_120101 [Caerostris extrusa]|uniref:Uncharacterized protein n=1 Tax=Caerostris extrusa TaxID=172846 RepID=A0AAV4RKH4_CAEEX|nr:uncharacterized protein CEXT_120101 [Caerostris extrusa]
MGKKKNRNKQKNKNQNALGDNINGPADTRTNMEFLDMESWIGSVNDSSVEKQKSSDTPVMPNRMSTKMKTLPNMNNSLNFSREKVSIESMFEVKKCNDKGVSENCKANAVNTTMKKSCNFDETPYRNLTTSVSTYNGASSKSSSNHSDKIFTGGKANVVNTTIKKSCNFDETPYRNLTTSVSTYNGASSKSSSNHSDKIFIGAASYKTDTNPKASNQYIPKKEHINNLPIQKNNTKYSRHIYGGVKRYEEKWDTFHKKYLIWRRERLSTISELQELKEKVHNDQLSYNQTNVMFKELNMGSRMVKDGNSNATVDFFASLATFLSDTASGITSMAQAFNAEGYSVEFQKIMEHDAEITKSLYTARSQCVEQYRDVEEIIRYCHSETFGNTLGNISKTLKLEDLWMDLKSSDGENTVVETAKCLDRFFARNINSNVLGEVYNSFEEYVNSNPAALDACKSAGKAFYGVYDTWIRDPKQQGSIANTTNIVANRMIIQEERREISHLRCLTENSEMSQAKLESKIEDAIDSLEYELNEISSYF